MVLDGMRALMQTDMTFITSPPLSVFALRSDGFLPAHGAPNAVGEGSLEGRDKCHCDKCNHGRRLLWH